VETRWLRWVGPGVIAVMALGAVASSGVGAGQLPWAPRSCAETEGPPAAAARQAVPDDLAGLAGQPWLRLDARLDRRGELQGQRLVIGLAGERTTRTLDLPAESFAAGPFGRSVLVGADDGALSRLAVIDVIAGCAWHVGEEASVIRRATIDPTGTTIYEMRVDRTTRVDLGIWARPVDSSALPRRVIEPIPADERFGRTFAGHRLVAESCGEAACRARVFDPDEGIVHQIAEADLGPLIGLAGDQLVSYLTCPGRPCTIVNTDTTTGDRTTLSTDAGTAVLIDTQDGPGLVHERFESAGIGLRSISLDGSEVRELAGVTGDLRLHASQPSTETATTVPDGWVVLSPDGRLPAAGLAGLVELRHVPDDVSAQVEEVTR
jgi:hypothetical protein